MKIYIFIQWPTTGQDSPNESIESSNILSPRLAHKGPHKFVNYLGRSPFTFSIRATPLNITDYKQNMVKFWNANYINAYHELSY